MIFRVIYTFLFLSIFCFQLSAQFSLSAEIRPRTEYRDGFKTPGQSGDEAVFFTEQRSRLTLGLVDTSYTFKLSFQDVRIWGENDQIFKQEDGNTFLSEAWVDYRIAPKWSVKLGRQIISYDNQRYLGGLEWAQQGRRHDALLFIYKNNQSRLDVGLAYNSDDDVPEPQNIQSSSASFYSRNNYKYMQYAWFNKKLDRVSLSFLAMNLGFQYNQNNVSNRQTLGSYGKTLDSKLNFGWDLYYQLGKQGESDVSAYLAGINITYKTSLSPITLGIEFISGKDSDDLTSDQRHFLPDFGTNHAHNGYMDYFFVGPSNGNVGLTDIYLKTKFDLGKPMLAVHVHQFFMGSDRVDSNNMSLSRSMGTEFDFVLARSISKDANLKLGYSFLLATDTMKTLRNRDRSFNSWAWVMFTVKPVLFTSKK